MFSALCCYVPLLQVPVYCLFKLVEIVSVSRFGLVVRR